MKNRLSLFLITAIWVGVSATAHAGSDVRFSINTPWVGASYGPRYVPAYYYPYWEHRRYYHPRRYAYAPVVVTAPTYVVPAPVVAPVPYPAPAATYPALSGNYGNDLAGLNGKLARLRGVLQSQNSKGTITSEQYNQFMDELDGIEHDEHERAYQNNGNLTEYDFADLYNRATQAGDEIEVALAQ